MSIPDRPLRSPEGRVRLPADDPTLFELDLDGLAVRWAEAMARAPMTAEEMTGADARAQRMGVPGIRLMEQAGSAVAAVAHALAIAGERWESGPILVLCGSGNNGGDGFVAARRLAAAGARVGVALVASGSRPGAPDAARNWDRLGRLAGIERVHVPVARDVAAGPRRRARRHRDALLGTGVRGLLREPVRSAVDLTNRARAAGVPVLAVDCPTAVDLSSGELSDPVVRADVTVTFHRPKAGLLTRRGAAVAGRVLVAPIGIPPGADRAWPRTGACPAGGRCSSWRRWCSRRLSRSSC
jgi:NAD(P)H-hydrate epimerase